MSEPDAPILRHVDEAPATGSTGDPELLAAVTDHVERHIGPVGDVWHQLVSGWVHVDVLIVSPTEERPFYTLVTAGMAERAMAAPDGDPNLAYTELVMALPEEWPLQEDAGRWPLGLLQDLAELPHRFDTWLWAGHTVPNGDPPAPYAADTKLCGVVLATPLLVPDEFDGVRAGAREVHFQSVIPLHREEMDLKLRRGVEELFKRLEAAEVTEGLIVDRPSVAGGRLRSRFGFRRS